MILQSRDGRKGQCQIAAIPHPGGLWLLWAVFWRDEIRRGAREGLRRWFSWGPGGGGAAGDAAWAQD
jgi:hypothetical protein